MNITGSIKKMIGSLQSPIEYLLPIGDQTIPMNPLIGTTIKLTNEGLINCIACGRKTNKSFSQGHCFPCMRSLPQCDSCIIKPELCHFDQGTCRDEQWGKDNCLRDHFVYLANSSGVKVGITRGTQVPTRWIDQGASQALPIFRVSNRLLSGRIEVALKAHVADKTDWRKMLKGQPEPVDLVARAEQLMADCSEQITAIEQEFGIQSITRLKDEAMVQLDYPVEQYREKVKALNLEKTPEIEGTLVGIKGQYLIFDIGVLNIRKYTGYQLTLSA